MNEARPIRAGIEPGIAASTTALARNVLLRFADGVDMSLVVPPGSSVLEAGLEAGAPLLYQCRSGSCSSCVAKLVSGVAQPRSGASSTLLRSEYEAGHRLLCLTQPGADCVFELAYDSTEGGSRPQSAKAFIDAIERIAPNVVRVRMELAEGQWLDFRPGQFVQVTVPGAGVVRSYSPASTPGTLPKIEFLIRLLPGGAMSAWLTEQAKLDDVVELEGPFGGFFLRKKIRVPHILVAGGTGLAPILSIIDTIRAQSGCKPPMLLSFGCASPETLFALDDLTLRGHWLPGLETRISVDRGGGDELLTGTPVDALREGDAAGPGTVAYVCGPPPMVEAARQRLEAIGVAPENIFAEQFVASR